MNRGLLAVAAVTALVVGGMLGPGTPGAFAAPGGGRALCIPLLMDCSSDGGGSGDGGGVLDGVDGVVDAARDEVGGLRDLRHPEALAVERPSAVLAPGRAGDLHVVEPHHASTRGWSGLRATTKTRRKGMITRPASSSG